MLIAQISDLHVSPSGQLYHGVADTNRMLGQAIEHLHGLDREPDLLLITGDLVDEGSPGEYAELRRMLAPLRIPFVVIPGNHDHRENFRAAFADHAYLPAEGALHYCLDNHAVRIVGLDSCVPGLHHGHIDEAGLQWLARTLAADRGKPTLVMLHHPPFRCGIPYMDDCRYMDPAPLERVLRSAGNVELVVCGHVHRSMSKRWAGTIVSSCPSTVTEIALQLAPHAAPQSHVGPRACMLHLWDEAHGMVSHVSHIGSFDGPHAFA